MENELEDDIQQKRQEDIQNMLLDVIWLWKKQSILNEKVKQDLINKLRCGKISKLDYDMEVLAYEKLCKRYL